MCRRERVFQQALRCLHSRMSSCHFPEKSASLNASHETGLRVLGLPQEKEPAGRLRQGLPLPDISSRISLHYVPSLCRWRVQWKIPESLEQMPLFRLHRSVVLALLTRRHWSWSHWTLFWGLCLYNSSAPLCRLKLEKAGGSVGENRTLRRPHFCEVGSSMQLLSSHEERGQRLPTDSEGKSRSWPTIAMETCGLRLKQSKDWVVVLLFIFSLSPSSYQARI